MAKKIRKAVIPAAGLGTRFLPASKAIPKEMLPVVDKPVIQYVVEELVDSGIEQIVIVTGWHKRTIEDHFDYPFELEYRLKESGKSELFEAQRRIADAAEFVYVRQREPLGTGHAIMQARSIIGDEPFLVHFADDIIVSPKKPVARQLMDVFAKYERSVLAVLEAEPEEIQRYAMVEGVRIADRTYQVDTIIEKPKPEEVRSNLGQVTEYILTPEWFHFMEGVAPSPGGEIWPTEAMRRLAKTSGMYAYEFEGVRYDCGSKLGYLKANVDFALARPDIQKEFAAFVRSRMGSIAL